MASRKSIIAEAHLDREARLLREELAERKLARDLRRREQADQTKDALRRLADKGSKPR